MAVAAAREERARGVDRPGGLDRLDRRPSDQQGQVASVAARSSRASRASSVSVGGMWLLTNAKTSSAAAGVGDQAGEGAGPGEGAGLGPDPAAPGRAVEAVGERPVVRRDGQAGDDRAQLGVVAGRGELQDVDQRLGPEPVVAGEPAAVVDLRALQVDPQVRQGLRAPPRRRRRTTRARSRPAPVWWPSTSAPSLSLTCSTRSTMSASGRLVTRATSRAVGGRGALRDVPVTSMPSCRGTPRTARPRSRRGRARGCRRVRCPRSAHSAVIGETSASGT